MAEEFLIFKETGAVSDDSSKWVEGTISTTGDPFIDMPAKLFYTGTHKGETFTTQRLDKVVDNFQKPSGERDWSVPAQLDHSEGARDTIGNLRDVWRTGQELWGTARFIGQEAVSKAKNGIWRKLSLSVYPKSHRIREFSVTPFPHLVGASTFSDTPDTESEEDFMAKPTTTTQKAQEEPTTNSEGSGETPMSYADRMIAKMREEFDAKTSSLEQRLELSEAKSEGLEQVLRFKELTEEIEKFSEAGKTAPTMRSAEIELVKTFSEEQMALYRTVKEAQPAFVHLDTLGDQDPDKVKAYKASMSDDAIDEKQIEADAAKYA